MSFTTTWIVSVFESVWRLALALWATLRCVVGVIISSVLVDDSAVVVVVLSGRASDSEVLLQEGELADGTYHRSASWCLDLSGSNDSSLILVGFDNLCRSPGVADVLLVSEKDDVSRVEAAIV